MMAHHPSIENLLLIDDNMPLGRKKLTIIDWGICPTLWIRTCGNPQRDNWTTPERNIHVSRCDRKAPWSWASESNGVAADYGDPGNVAMAEHHSWGAWLRTAADNFEMTYISNPKCPLKLSFPTTRSSSDRWERLWCSNHRGACPRCHVLILCTTRCDPLAPC